MTKVEKKFLKKCKFVIDNCHYILLAGKSYGANTILESFEAFETDKQFSILKKDIEKEYDIEYYDLKRLFVDNILDTDWCDIIAQHKIKQLIKK
jgi:hypothetical protein